LDKQVSRVVRNAVEESRIRRTLSLAGLCQGRPSLGENFPLAFTPFPISPVYGATKAGLHSFTQSLRVQLKNTSIKVFELAPPSTQTPLQNVFDPSETKGSPMMHVTKLVRQAIRGFQKDHLEILSGVSKVLRLVSRIAPGLAVKAASGPVDAMLAQTKL
jgi:uncharacterized oxidoreductase